MIRRPPRSTRTDTLFPYTTLFRSYLFATDGDARVDPMYARNMAAAREAGVRTGPIHRYDLCKLATDQAANFIRHVPRRPDALPAVVWLDCDVRCPDRPRPDERRVGTECVRKCKYR